MLSIVSVSFSVLTTLCVHTVLLGDRTQDSTQRKYIQGIEVWVFYVLILLDTPKRGLSISVTSVVLGHRDT